MLARTYGTMLVGSSAAPGEVAESREKVSHLLRLGLHTYNYVIIYMCCILYFIYCDVLLWREGHLAALRDAPHLHARNEPGDGDMFPRAEGRDSSPSGL